MSYPKIAVAYAMECLPVSEAIYDYWPVGSHHSPRAHKHATRMPFIEAHSLISFIVFPTPECTPR